MIHCLQHHHTELEFVRCATRDGMYLWRDEEGTYCSYTRMPVTIGAELLFPTAEALFRYSLEHDFAPMIALPGWQHCQEADGHSWYMVQRPTVGIKWTPGRGWRGTWADHGLAYFTSAQYCLEVALPLTAGTRTYLDELYRSWEQDRLSPVPLGFTWWHRHYGEAGGYLTAWQRAIEQEAEADRMARRAVARCFDELHLLGTNRTRGEVC